MRAGNIVERVIAPQNCVLPVVLMLQVNPCRSWCSDLPLISQSINRTTPIDHQTQDWKIEK